MLMASREYVFIWGQKVSYFLIGIQYKVLLCTIKCAVYTTVLGGQLEVST